MTRSYQLDSKIDTQSVVNDYSCYITGILKIANRQYFSNISSIIWYLYEIKSGFWLKLSKYPDSKWILEKFWLMRRHKFVTLINVSYFEISGLKSVPQRGGQPFWLDPCLNYFRTHQVVKSPADVFFCI